MSACVVRAVKYPQTGTCASSSVSAAMARERHGVLRESCRWHGKYRHRENGVRLFPRSWTKGENCNGVISLCGPLRRSAPAGSAPCVCVCVCVCACVCV